MTPPTQSKTSSPSTEPAAPSKASTPGAPASLKTRAEIEAGVLEWILETPWRHDDQRFSELAVALFRFQYDACKPYARLCEALHRTPDQVSHYTEIPAVPTGAFKEFDLCSFDLTDSIKTFRTSGTSTDRRGQLHLDSLVLYEASLLASLRENFLDELRGHRPSMHFLAPPPAESPDSSLTHMFETLRVAEGNPQSAFYLRSGELQVNALMQSLSRAAEDSSPVLVLGTSFAFVHLLDATTQSREADWRLPPGSRVMETGGFKGRSREVPSDLLRAEIADRFGIPETSVINQYGMTELGSQFYDSTWRQPTQPRHKVAPPWTRVRIIDPETNLDVSPGEEGMIVIHDLANAGSVAAIQTADLGRTRLDEAGQATGFSVLGRFEGAEQRGCSIATDIMLDASRRALSP